MPKIETLKDLMIASDLSMGEVRNLTKLVFDGESTLTQDVLPYNITMPKFEDMADHIQQFLIKAMLEAKIVNLFDQFTPEEDADDCCGEDCGKH